jgi:hypothetical protein
MTKITQTLIKETDDMRIIKVFDKDGNKWATDITSFNAECKHCNFVQVQNRDDIIYHLKTVHKIEY